MKICSPQRGNRLGCLALVLVSGWLGALLGVVFTGSREHASTRMNVTSSQVQPFWEALGRLKGSGEYEDIVAIHGNLSLFNTVHGSDWFLPFHRWYLLRLERVLGNRIGIPYWDWSSDWAHPESSKVWDVVGAMGTANDSYCLRSGPFKDWEAGFRCIQRIGDPSIRIWDPESLARLVTQTPRDSFRIALETQAHAAVHLYVGGTMKGYRSPDDPLFWLHHAFVDLIWLSAQVYHKDWMYGVPKGFQHMTIPGTDELVDDLLIPRGYRYDRLLDFANETLLAEQHL